MTCTDGSISCWVTSKSQILVNVANNLVPVEPMLTGGAYIMGIGFAMKAIMSLKQMGENRNNGAGGLKEPIVYFFVASMLVYFPTGFAVVMNTTFGYSSPLSYTTLTSTNSATFNSLFGPNSETGAALVYIIQLIGMVAFIRGWVLIARTASQGQPPGGTGQGITHIVGGIFAMNIVGTIQIIINTLFT